MRANPLTIFIVFIAIFGHLNAFSQDKTIFFEEDFDGWTSLTAEGWSVINPVGWNFINPSDDYMDFFKQDPADYMMLISPEIDFTNINLLEFIHQSGSSVANQKIEVGVITNPLDPTTFEILNIVDVAGYEWTDAGANTSLDAITGMGHLAFNVSAASPGYTIIKIDDVVLSDEGTSMDQPSFITDLELTPALLGENSVLVSWVNPEIEADGGTLMDLDSVAVFEYGVWLGSVTNPVIGEPSDIQIDVPIAGLYVFTVIAYNSVGPSIPIDNEPPVWIGLDTPSFPENIVLSVTGENTSNLSWTPPSIGAHGAYFDGEVSAYKIVRADGQEYIVDGDVLSFTEEVPIQGTYNYAVSCVNDSGEGADAYSNAGAYYFDNVILAEDYYVSNPAFGWTYEGQEGNTYHWFTDYSGGNYGESIFYPNEIYSGEASFISPVVSAEGYEALTLRFRHSHNNVFQNYTFTVNTTSNGGTTWNEVWSSDVSVSVDPTSELVVIDNEDVGSPNFQIAFVLDGTSSAFEFMSLDDIWVYEASEHDLTAVSLSIPSQMQPGATMTPEANVDSWGYLETDYTATLTFYQGTDVVYTSVINSSIDGGADALLEFEDWVALEGSFTAELVVLVDNDETPNNNSISEDFNVYFLNAERTLVICEEGTGTWCGYCPGAAMGLDDLDQNGWPVGVIAYHKDDEYETPEGLERLNYYGVEGFPTVIFDGVVVNVGGSATESMYDVYTPIVQERLGIAAAVAIDVENAYMDNNILHVDILLESGSPIHGDSIALFSVFSESDIPEAWLGQEDLDYVQRTIYGGATGQLVDLSDLTESIHVAIEVDPSWVLANSELIMFVQNLDDKEIYNGNKIHLVSVSIDEIEKWVAIYPNPANDFIVISGNDASELNLINMQGQIVLSENIPANHAKINVSNLEFGIYVLELVVDGNRFTKKIMINN